MGEMIDAVNPANIGPEWDHGLALRISVLADPAGQAFDFEAGDAGAGPVSWAMGVRFGERWWSVGYVNGWNIGELTAAMANRGLSWTDADRFPAPGVYLWAADPSGNIAAGRWRLPVIPVAVQDRYLGSYDLSTTHPAFPFTVAGYIDGARSAWPVLAWARYARLLDTGGIKVTQLNRPICAIVKRPQGDGEWVIAQDGGIFAFGNAPNFGNGDPLPAEHLNGLIVDAACTPDGEGLTLVGSDGGIFEFGHTVYWTSLPQLGVTRSAQPWAV